MTDDAIRKQIRSAKAARKNGHWQDTLRRILKHAKAGRTYSVEDIEVFIVKSGGKFPSAGGAITYAVREGYLNRVGRGQYLVTGKKMEG